MQCSVVLHHHNIFKGYTFQRLSKKNKDKPRDLEARGKWEPIPTSNSQTASKKVPKSLLIQKEQPLLYTFLFAYSLI